MGSRYIIDIKLTVSLQKHKSAYTPAGVHPNYVGQYKVLISLAKLGLEQKSTFYIYIFNARTPFGDCNTKYHFHEYFQQSHC